MNLSSISGPGLLLTATLAIASAVGAAADPPPSADTLPTWAFVPTPPGGAAAAHEAAVDDVPRHLPGSHQSFTTRQIDDLYQVADWHPDQHPPLPQIVAKGRRPELFACAYCHLPDGLGRPENAALAGLSEAYIVEQLTEFGSGRRRGSNPPPNPAATMAKIGARVTDAEARIAARYFAGLRPRPWIRVVESGEVPHMRVAGWMMVPDGSTREPIGERIIEMPVDPERTELRDDASGFVAWVPPGSLRRGAQLAQTGGGGTTIPCASCHGPGLKGQGDVPPLAGRSPSYVVRQLYDIRHGQRSGPTVAPMQPVVAQLGLRDMVALAAYTASLPP